MQDVSPRQLIRENVRSQSALKHRELNHTILNLAMCESRASGTLERVPMFVEIAQGLILGSKRRLEMAHLPNRAPIAKTKVMACSSPRSVRQSR
jgi:hypothetical protein